MKWQKKKEERKRKKNTRELRVYEYVYKKMKFIRLKENY